MKLNKFFLFLFLAACASSKEHTSPRPLVVPTPSCNEGVGCGMVGAIGAASVVAQTGLAPTPVKGKNGILIRCRFTQKGSDFPLPCGSTQIKVLSEKSEPLVMIGSGEEIIIPHLKTSAVYDVEVTQRGCPVIKAKGLKVGDAKDVLLSCP